MTVKRYILTDRALVNGNDLPVGTIISLGGPIPKHLKGRVEEYNESPLKDIKVKSSRRGKRGYT